jgi:outer membrane receptor for ferrienterochelin and colicins
MRISFPGPVIGLCLLVQTGFAQQATIHLQDSKTEEAIPFANVCFETLDKKKVSYGTSDANGDLKNPVISTSKISVSSIGYAPLIDTIHVLESRTFLIEPTTYKMDEVVVTGQFQPVRADQSIYRVEVINSSVIADKAANNLAEALSGQLNMRIRQDAMLGTGISIQGLSGENVKVLVNGIPMIGRQNGILDLTQLNLSNVDPIEVIEGPMSVIYGSNALAGAINVIRKQNVREKLSAGLDTYYETVGVYNLNGNVAGSFGKNTIRFTGGRNFFGGYSPVDTTRQKLWLPKEQYNADLILSRTFRNSTLILNSTLFREELRNRGNILRTPVFVGAFDQYHYTRRYSNRIEWQQNFHKNRSLSANASILMYSKIKKTTANDLVNLRESLASAEMQDTTRIQSYMSRIIYNNNTGSRLTYQSGLDLNYESAEGKRLMGTKSMGDYSAFLSAKYAPVKQMEFQIGSRVIHNTKYPAPFIYSLNMKWIPSDRFSLRASYGKGFRAPSLKELYLEFIDSNHHVLGNDSLEAEFSQNFNLAGKYSFEVGMQSISTELNLFYNTIRNKIDFVLSSTDATEAMYYNIKNGIYKTNGLELKVVYRFHPRLIVNTGVYLLGRSKLPASEGYYYSTDYTTDFSYKNIKYNFRLALFYKYTDDYSTITGMFDENNQLSDVTIGFIKHYSTIDITFTKGLLHEALELGCGVKNLLDVTNVYTFGDGGAVHGGGQGSGSPVGWGRTYFIRLNYSFQLF